MCNEVSIDLHTHSICSDGSDSPVELIDLAAAAGLRAISLTDHDTVTGLAAAAARAAELDIEFMPGIELSCHTGDRTIHLLGYNFDTTNLALVASLANQQRSRTERNTLLVERLAALGYFVTLEEIEAHANGGTVGRPHVAAVLMKHGYVNSIEHAFDELLAQGKPAYVERRELPASDAISLIHEAGGAAIWAHPTRSKAFDENHFRSTLDELVDSKLDGFECWYSRFTPDHRRQMARIARKYELIATGGSDYHGAYKPDLNVGTGTGDLHIPYEVFEELRQRSEKFAK